VTIFNRRNAALGWFTWEVGKRFARKKAKSAVPAVDEGRPNKSLILSAVAAAGAVLFFWRRKRSDEIAPE
jgi:hypothetical protein